MAIRDTITIYCLHCNNRFEIEESVYYQISSLFARAVKAAKALGWTLERDRLSNRLTDVRCPNCQGKQ